MMTFVLMMMMSIKHFKSMTFSGNLEAHSHIILQLIEKGGQPCQQVLVVKYQKQLGRSWRIFSGKGVPRPLPP